MKKRIAIGVGALLTVGVLLWAQAPAAPVQQVGTMLNAMAPANYNGTAQGTITLTAPPGQFVYVGGLDLQYCASGTAGTAGTPVFTTTTNLPSLPRIGTDTGIAANTCISRLLYPGFPLKSAAAGTAVTVVTPAAQTNITYNLNVYYYYGL